MKPIAVAVCLWLMASGAQAQPIYRCGTEYSRTPCPGGKMLESSDPRSAAQRAEAVRVAAQDRKKAAAMERERRAQESGAKPLQAAGFNGRPPPPESAASGAERGKLKKASKAKPAKSADFVAVEPGSSKKRQSK
jgi:hypothetical protein